MHHDQRCEVHLGSSPISLVCVSGGGCSHSQIHTHESQSKERAFRQVHHDQRCERAKVGEAPEAEDAPILSIPATRAIPELSSEVCHERRTKERECSPGLFMDCSCVCVCACVCFCSEGGGRARRTVRGSGGAACGAASERMSALSCTPNPRHSAAARRASAIPLAITSKR